MVKHTYLLILDLESNQTAPFFKYGHPQALANKIIIFQGLKSSEFLTPIRRLRWLINFQARIDIFY